MRLAAQSDGRSLAVGTRAAFVFEAAADERPYNRQCCLPTDQDLFSQDSLLTILTFQLDWFQNSLIFRDLRLYSRRLAEPGYRRR